MNRNDDAENSDRFSIAREGNAIGNNDNAETAVSSGSVMANQHQRQDQNRQQKSPGQVEKKQDMQADNRQRPSNDGAQDRVLDPALRMEDASYDPSPLTVAEMEKLTCRAQMTVTFQERTRAMEDLHGISSKNMTIVLDNTQSFEDDRQEEQQHRQLLLTAMGMEIARQEWGSKKGTKTEGSSGAEIEPLKLDDSGKLSMASVDSDQDEEPDESGEIDQSEQDLRWAFILSCCHHNTRLTAELFRSDPKCMNQVVEMATQKYLLYKRELEQVRFPRTNSEMQLQYNDLSAYSQGILLAGCFQVLPQTDQAGRKIVAIFPNQIPSLSQNDYRSSMLAAAFYFWSRVEFPTNSRDCILLYYDPNCHNSSSPNTNQQQSARTALQSVLQLCCQCLPIRLASLHIVQKRQSNDDAPNYPSQSHQELPTFWRNLPPSLQMRTEFYFVDFSSDFQREVQRFGMRLTLIDKNKTSSSPSSPPDAIEFPVDADGKMHLQQHLSWFHGMVRDATRKEERTQVEELLQPDDLQEWAELIVGMERPIASAKITMDPALSLQSSGTTSSPSGFAGGSTRFPAVMDPTQTNLIFVVPTERDVLFGRGMAIQRHKGNISFRNRLTTNVDAYYQADNVEKVILVDYLLHQFQAEGIRFLKHDLSGGEPLGSASLNLQKPSEATSAFATTGMSATFSNPPSSSSTTSSSLDSSSGAVVINNSLSVGPQQDVIFNGRWTVVHSKQAIYSKFCQTFRSIRAAQRRQQKQQLPP